MRWEGKLDLIGLSSVDRPSVERALHLVDVAEIQNAYSVITNVAALDRAGGRPERIEGSTAGLNRSGRLPRQSRDQT